YSKPVLGGWKSGINRSWGVGGMVKGGVWSDTLKSFRQPHHRPTNSHPTCCARVGVLSIGSFTAEAAGIRLSARRIAAACTQRMSQADRGLDGGSICCQGPKSNRRFHFLC